MKDNIILSKASGMEEVKKYFTAVLELSKSNEEFPVNLDEVWMLVYSEKGKAVRALTTNEQFIEGIDYKVFAQNGENPQGGRPTNEYYLSISCLEFFIARKVRAVFEVYRQVFHHVAQGMMPSYQIEDPIDRAELWIEEQKEKKALEEKNAAMQPKADYFDNLVEKGLLTNFRDTAKEIGLKQNEFIDLLLKKKFIYRNKKKQLKPYSQFNGDLFELKDWGNDKATGLRTLITPKGKETFRLLFGMNNQLKLDL